MNNLPPKIQPVLAIIHTCMQCSQNCVVTCIHTIICIVLTDFPQAKKADCVTDMHCFCPSRFACRRKLSRAPPLDDWSHRSSLQSSWSTKARPYVNNQLEDCWFICCHRCHGGTGSSVRCVMVALVHLLSEVSWWHWFICQSVMVHVLSEVSWQHWFISL